MYRRSLAASWVRQPGELPPDQCIEDIFAGGDGWSPSPSSGSDPSSKTAPQRHPSQTSDHSTSSDNGPSRSRSLERRRVVPFDGGGDLSDDGMAGDTLRPSDYRRMNKNQQQQSHPGPAHGLMHAFTPHLASHRHRDSRHNSNASDRSVSTVTGRNPPFLPTSSPYLPTSSPHLDNTGGFFTSSYTSYSRPNSRSGSRHQRDDSAASSREELGGARSRRGSLTSLAPTMGSGSSGRKDNKIGGEYRKARELEEFEVRDDMVAWRLPGAVR